jgi:hypothetical protein
MNKEALLKKFTVGSELVEIEGSKVRLKEMSGKDRDSYFTKLASADKIKMTIDGEEKEFPDVSGVKTYLIASLVVDEKLAPLLSEEEVENLSVEFVDKAFNEIARINKLADAEIDDAEKN